jgi:putative redox protein
MAETQHPGAVVVAETGESRFTQRVEAGRHQFLADEPKQAGGADLGPNPYDLLLAALGTCTSMTLRMYADRKGWKLTRIEVRLRHGKIHAEDCATCETTVGLVDVIVRELVLTGDLSPDQRTRLVEIAEKCPVHRTLTGEIHIITRQAEVLH